MKLLIHDLKTEEWNKIAQNYATNWQIISDNGAIKPCNGCFGCFVKDPGKCIVHDGYENMGYLIHHAEEVVVISRYTWGCFSSFVKNVCDRSLGYILPYLGIYNGESHHKKRYKEDKPWSFIFYGHNINDTQKECAIKYVNAVCVNLKGYVKEILFHEWTYNCSKITETTNITNHNIEGKIILLNASMRSSNANSAKLINELKMQLNKNTEIINIANYINRMTDLLNVLSDTSVLVLCTPLYVDGLPAQLIRLMETFANKYNGASKQIYVLTNMGLYESRQLVNLFSSVKQWCIEMNFTYGGGLDISGGELPNLGIKIPLSWTKKNYQSAMKIFCEAINKNDIKKDLYTEPYLFPRFLYIYRCNRKLRKMAKANGLPPKLLYRCL